MTSYYTFIILLSILNRLYGHYTTQITLFGFNLHSLKNVLLLCNSEY